MKIDDAIRRRRSVREYTDEIPKEEDIRKILEAGVWAPSGLNNQPWKFKVVVENGQKDGLSRFTKYGRIIRGAPVAICVFLDNGATYNREKDLMAIGACIQNMLLEACELGLGTCWLGEILNRRREVEEFLGTNSDYELAAVVTMGVPREGPTKGCRKNLESFLV